MGGGWGRDRLMFGEARRGLQSWLDVGWWEQRSWSGWSVRALRGDSSQLRSCDPLAMAHGSFLQANVASNFDFSKTGNTWLKAYSLLLRSRPAAVVDGKQSLEGRKRKASPSLVRSCSSQLWRSIYRLVGLYKRTVSRSTGRKGT